MEDAHAKKAEDVLEELGSRSGGLTEAEAKARLEKYGPNDLPKGKEQSLLLLFLGQFTTSLNYVLFAAAGISWYTGHAFDAGAIMLIVVFNGLIGFYQERRAEKAIEKLQDLSVPHVNVRRGGQVARIRSVELVPGDIVLVAEGVRVSADMRILSEHDLRADEAALTGESVPVSKSADAIGLKAAIGDRKNILYRGTLLTSGEGTAVVVKTGSKTEFGRIAKSLSEIKREKTSFERRIDRLGRALGIIAVLAAGLIFVVGILRGLEVLEMFLFAVATAVSAIPEGLPIVLIIVLSVGVWRMAKRNAVTRHMPAVETLGVVDVICSDKTGTLTENKMTVRRIATVDHTIDVTGEGWKPEGDFLMKNKKIQLAEHPVISHILRTAALCNEAGIEKHEDHLVAIGDPTEAALIVVGQKGGFEKSEMLSTERTIDEIPFSSERKFRAILHRYTGTDEKPVHEIMVVGAYEKLLGMSDRLMSENAPKELTPQDAAVFDRMNEELAGEAMRVLAVAVKEVPADMEELHEDDLKGMVMHGLIGMIDPPREGIKESVRMARAAGIRLMMNTGDHRATAVAIAKEIGMLDEDEETKGRVFTDHEAQAMSDEELSAVLEKAVVFARVTPQTKLRIVTLLQEKGHAVAMTGDGINDAPSLKQADIGVAMGINGTDVTKEVADMVLADDNFNSIISAVEEGRIVFRNVKQTTGFLVMTNAGEIVTLLSTMLIGLPLPLLPAQVLWLNIVTDGVTDNALAVEGEHGDELRSQPRKKDSPILTKDLLILTLLTAALMAGGTILLFSWALGQNGIGYARTVAFLSMSLFQLWNIFNMRSAKLSILTLGFFSNRWIVGAVGLSLSLIAMIMYVPFFQPFFKLEPVGLFEWGIAALVSSSVIFLVEGYKVLIRRKVIPESWV